MECVAHLTLWALERHLHPLKPTLMWTHEAGKKAIEYINSGYLPDIAFLDLRINSINGIDIARVLLKKDPNMPVLIITGADNKELDYQEAVQLLGEHNVIQKEKVHFAKDLLAKIPNLKGYLRCGANCLKAVCGGMATLEVSHG